MAKIKLPSAEFLLNLMLGLVLLVFILNFVLPAQYRKYFRL